MEVLCRLQEQGYPGCKSALYKLIRRLRVPVVAPQVGFEGVPGEFSQHDFGQVDVRYAAGRVERLRFFASHLKWSRTVHVVFASDEREEALLRGLLAAFGAFGGVPLVTVWDNPKTVVLSRKGDLMVWNPVFGQVALAPQLCWPRAANHKATVENLVGWVKASFFKCRRFHDRADLEAQLISAVAGGGEHAATEPGHRDHSRRPTGGGAPAAAGAADSAGGLRPEDPRRGAARARVVYDAREDSMPPETPGPGSCTTPTWPRPSSTGCWSGAAWSSCAAPTIAPGTRSLT